jgi:hypothetical protein
MVMRCEAAARTPASDAGAAPASSSGSEAARLPRLGFLSTGRADNASSAAFREGLRQAGQVEGQTFLLEPRFGEGENDRLPALAAELVALPVDLIAVIGAVTVRAVRRASATVRLLFTIVLDPLADGLVPDMERPGGDTSGVTNFDPPRLGRRCGCSRRWCRASSGWRSWATRACLTCSIAPTSPRRRPRASGPSL